MSKVKKVLVIKMRHHGDVLLTSPLFSALKSQLPEATIDAYIYQDTYPMLEGHPQIQKFFLYDKGWKKLSRFQKTLKEITLLKEIQSQKYDMIINLTEGDRGALVGLFSQAKYIVGFDPGKQGFLGKKSIYTHIVKNCRTPRHAVERNLDAVRRIGIQPTDAQKELVLAISEVDAAKGEALLKEINVQKKDYILIHAGSRWKFKCLSPQVVASFIEELHQKGHTVVMTGSPDSEEKKMIETILEKIPHIPVRDVVGKTSLKELAFLIREAKALVTVDTVSLHIASAFKTPMVCVFGPTSFIEWGPWKHPKVQIVSQGFSCQPCGLDGCGGSKVSDCLQSISSIQLIKALERLFSKTLPTV